MRVTHKIAVSAVLTLGLVTGIAGGAQAQSNTTYRWGSSFGSHEDKSPTIVGGLTDVSTLIAGNSSSLAIDDAGNVWTWGLGLKYELGNGGTSGYLDSAFEVPGIPPAVGIAESYDTDVAITATGDVYGWGHNGSGELCTGGHASVAAPEQLTGLSNVAMAAGAGGHILYLLTDGTLEACGNNVNGQLGNGTKTNSEVPVTVKGLPSSPIVALSAGWADSSVLLQNGQVWDWGFNRFGNLGAGTRGNSDVPVLVKLPSAATEVYQGGSDPRNGQSLALLANGQVWGWGNNGNGQLGNGATAKTVRVPVQATALPAGVTFSFVATGGNTSYGLDSNGNVWAWGENGPGQIGNGAVGANVLTPVQILSGATLISSTADNEAAVTG